ncbi:hypothetical protein RO3G_12384 [Rhizopus delemar RA 99-880]|uniref:CCHC-type domain-containing protein n=1 Tax=Rhizopus delemar (strain RA 99-880 / ATCC MYA-4621 / FGSC 9543 / NRRL 43880) TaxID=246409 RepID=I1CGU3_RHIO9|nr:hypothetical protein RO3G_12384 [Rhizopus delemar RA 99-880]|eukprot:EIE87673.1 hypothetical protein RO3G_12384 [Rhizopus delemar RA 99-880]
MCDQSKGVTVLYRPTTVSVPFPIKPLNLEGGQCSWCGKYGHQNLACPLLK